MVGRGKWEDYDVVWKRKIHGYEIYFISINIWKQIHMIPKRSTHVTNWRGTLWFQNSFLGQRCIHLNFLTRNFARNCQDPLSLSKIFYVLSLDTFLRKYILLFFLKYVTKYFKFVFFNLCFLIGQIKYVTKYFKFVFLNFCFLIGQINDVRLEKNVIAAYWILTFKFLRE